MSTHGVVAYTTQDNTIRAKVAHYGSIEDYFAEMISASFDKIKESVEKGDSTEPLKGFYLDPKHRHEMGWDNLPEGIINLDDYKTKEFSNMQELVEFAKEYDILWLYDRDHLEVFDSHGKLSVEDLYGRTPFLDMWLDRHRHLLK